MSNGFVPDHVVVDEFCSMSDEDIQRIYAAFKLEHRPPWVFLFSTVDMTDEELGYVVEDEVPGE